MVVSWIVLSIGIGLIFDIFILLLVWFLLLRLKDKKRSLFDLLKTRDGYYSLAYFQFFIWTLIFIFSLTSIYFIRLLNGNFEYIDQIPPQLLLLMGISVAVVPISGAISEIKYPEIQPNTVNNENEKSFVGMLMERGMPSIPRYQMFAWTLISAVIYLFIIYFTLFNKNLDIYKLTLPDIDPTLVFLMGLSQAGYIGGKFVVPGEMKITYITPKEGKKDDIINIIGFDFGDQEGLVEYNGQRITKFEKWTRTRIDMKIPSDIKPGNELKIISGGKISKRFIMKDVPE